jgi:DNA-binding transcriptional MerR regulator
MFRIGDFSRFTCVSVKMLRHYDEIGLLKPARVDAESGYRYYSADQLPRLNRIIALKELGFSLEQVAQLLNDSLSDEQIKGMLRLRRAEIERDLRAEEYRLAQVEARLWQIEQTQGRALYDVILRQVQPQMMATLRESVSSMGMPITHLFDELEAYVAAYRARAAASPLMLFHDTEYREIDLDIEVAVPLAQSIPDTDRIKVREVQGGPMACVVYTGSYSKTPEVLTTLLLWLQQHNYAIAGPLREVYLRFGADNVEKLNLPAAFLASESASYVTELQLPVRFQDKDSR